MIINNILSFFKYISFIFKKEDDTALFHLYIRNIISINIKNENNFMIIRVIYYYQKNDNL